ncbi:MAG: tRNA (adenosine(37)-N6)-threonylcarbamoyltransferase complex ATPase subunit type 1 TsaE [Acidimicrobiia bacterium]
MTCTIATSSPEETRAFAQRIGALLQPGDVVVLAGEMGAGKTAFAKGVALALGIDEPVASPTFTIVREYTDARIPLVHVDVYRLDHVQELHDLGLDDVLGEDAVTVVEWGDKVSAALPGDRLDIRIEFGDGDDDRVFTVDCSGASWVARRDAIVAAAGPR